MDADI
jgi:hypothetical protein